MADNIEKIISVKFDAQQAINGLTQLNRTIADNSERLREMRKNGEQGTKAYAQLEQETKALKKQKQDLSQVVQNEVKQQNSLQGSVRQMRAELSTLTRQYDALSKAERENVNVGGKLKSQINQLTNEIKAAEEGTQRYYRNVGNYQNAILGAIGLNGNFVSSIMGITGGAGGFGGAMSAMGASVKAFGASLMGLMANPAFIALAGIVGAGMAFKWFFDYNVGVEQATRLTREFTGVTGSELTHLRAEIKATADTFGKDYKEVLEAVDLLMSHFHLSSAEAINTINDGFTSGADINGDYLQLLQQYAPTFHDAGLEASQLVALIQQTRSGIFSKQGMEAIKQASARIREMSSGTRQSLQGIGIDVDAMQDKLRTGQLDIFGAIQMVSDKLKDTNNNTQEYGNVMADVFGRQGKFSSQEMIESLGEIDTNLQHLVESSGDYGKALHDNQQATADLEEEAAKMFGSGENGWETLKTRADTYWKQALANALKRTHSLIDSFVDMARRSKAFETLARVVWGVVRQLTFGIVDMFRNIGNGFKAMGSWLDAFVNTFKSAFGIIRDLGRGVGDILTGNVSQGISEITSGLSKGINNALKGINTALKDTSKAVSGVFTSFRRGYNEMGAFIDSYVPTASGAAGSWGDDVVNNRNASSGSSSGGGNKSNGKRGGSGGTSKRGGSTTTAKPKKTPEQLAEEEAQKRLNALIAEGEKLRMQALQERAKTEAKAIDELAEAQRQEIIKKYGTLAELQARLTAAATDEQKEQAQAAIDAYNQLMQGVEDNRSKAIAKMVEDSAKQRADQQAKADADAKALAQTWMEATDEASAKHLGYQLQLLELEKQAELAAYEGNEQMKQAIIAKYAKLEQDARKANADAIQQIEETKYEAIGTMVGGLGEIMGAFGEQSKEAAILQKTLALGEIMIAQAVAIANAVKAGSNAVTPWQLIAQIATSIVAVTSAMAQAFTALDSAKFATGGYVRGAGTSTSDSIPVRVSNGESIMNANTTAMFSGLLSSLNQLGGGVPIQAQQTASSVRGEDMLARAVAKGVAMLPAPVVSVQDINRGQRQVEVMNDRATL